MAFLTRTSASDALHVETAARLVDRLQDVVKRFQTCLVLGGAGVFPSKFKCMRWIGTGGNATVDIWTSSLLRGTFTMSCRNDSQLRISCILDVESQFMLSSRLP
jgi:hypothetical protein